MDAATRTPTAINEPVLDYAPGSAERASLEEVLKTQAAEHVELSMTIGGEQRLGAGGAAVLGLRVDDRRDIKRADVRVHAAVSFQIDRSDRRPRPRRQRRRDTSGRPGEGEHGTVMVGV